jgi:hypothetical protein
MIQKYLLFNKILGKFPFSYEQMSYLVISLRYRLDGSESEFLYRASIVTSDILNRFVSFLLPGPQVITQLAVFWSGVYTYDFEVRH